MTQGDPRTEGTITVRLEWDDPSNLTVMAMNRFNIGADPITGGIVITFGHVAPPLLLGAPDEQAQLASEIEYLPIRPLASFALPQELATELGDAIRAGFTDGEAAGE